MSILESVFQYLSSCPFLRPGPIGVNYLGSRPQSYTVDSVPGGNIIKRYTDGSSVRQFLFIFASREAYGVNQAENLENAKFYEQLSEWLESQSRLPQLGDGKQAISLEVLTGGYIMNAGTREARYQIQCGLNYFQEAL